MLEGEGNRRSFAGDPDCRGLENPETLLKLGDRQQDEPKGHPEA